jgi:tape measure domain-containing protein
MAQYEINFSTNASSAAVQLSKLEREITNVAKAGRKVTIDFGLNNTTSVSRMERELRRLQGEAARVAPNTADWVNFQQQIGRVSLEIGKVKKLAETIQLTESLGALAPSSLASLENRLTILRNRAREIAPQAKDWKAINKEIQDLERGIERINRKPLTLSQRAGAAGGAFLYGGGLGGGVGSALGGIAGGLAGGVPGAFAGAAIGQAVDNLGQYAAGIGQVVAETNKAKIALAGVSNDQEDYNKAIQSATQIGQDFLLPITDATKQYTKLQASVRGAGYDTETTTKVFQGIASAIVATGGNTEALNSALTATSQVFSKGKVSAEELRQQIGERLPGAFTIFAQSLGKSPQELDKLLSEGKVGLDDFIKFVEELEKRYGATAETLANAPENAGARLQVALNAATVTYGGFFQRVGAGFQNYLAGLLNFVIKNEKSIKRVVTVFAIGFKDLTVLVTSFAKFLGNAFNSAFSYILGNLDTVIERIEGAINRAKFAQGLTPQRIEQLQARARTETEQKFGINLFGAQTGLVIPGVSDVAKAEKHYNDLFNRLVDAETNAAQKASRTRKAESILFPEFEPDKFGAGLGNQKAIDNALAGEAGADKEKKTNLEAFERLRDQLADAYNRGEIERIKARYELEKRLREDLFDVQEFGANRLQRQNLQFLRALITAEQERFEANLEARLNVAQEAGKVDQATSAFSGGRAAALSDIGAYLQGNIGPTSTGPHFDVKRVGGGYFPRNYLDQFVQVNGRPLSSGTTVPGGTFAGHQRRGSHGWDYAFGSGRHAATLTGGAQWMEGVPTQHGERRRFKLPSGEIFQFLHGRGEGIGAGAPRKVGGNEARDTLAAANTEIAKGNALQVEQSGLLIKNSSLTKAFAQYAQDAYNVPDLKLETELQKTRNNLMEQGLNEEAIDYRLRLFEIEYQYADLLKRLPEYIQRANLSQEQRRKIEADLKVTAEEAKKAEKERNDQLERNARIRRNDEINKYINSLRSEIALLRAITEEERRRLEIQQEFGDATAEQQEQIYDLREIKQNLEEARRVIDEFVTGTTNDYKGFLKAVISGEDAKDALRQFQEGLRDRVLTIFLDFAMAPVEQFFQEQLKGIMNSLMPKASIEDTPQTRNTTALEQNTEAIKANTAALAGGQAPAQQAQSWVTDVPDFGAVASDALFSMGGRGAEAVNAPMAIDVTAFEGASDAVQGLNDSIYGMEFSLPSLGDSLGNISDTVYQASEDTKKQGTTLGESLGKATSAIGMAAGAIMGIAAGVGQIKKGGTANVLGGIGSIMLSLGGAIGGFGKLFGAANGGIATGGWEPMPIRPFANGGMVTGPTLGLVGEGKYNEAIVPLPNGRSIPVEMRGASSARNAMETGGMPTSTSPMLSLSFETTKIGGVEYVSRDQLELAMAATRREAIREGASRGMNMTIDKIKNSPSTRNSLGLRGR